MTRRPPSSPPFPSPPLSRSALHGESVLHPGAAGSERPRHAGARLRARAPRHEGFPRVRDPVSSLRASALRGGEESAPRSEEHTSELQSQSNLVCRLLLEKKN